MGIGKTPQNQLDALPLQDADSAAAGGQIQVVGGSMVRYFDANTLGINGVTAATFSSGAFSDTGLLTPFLNCVGCSKFIIVVRAFTTIIRAALAPLHVSVQVRLGASDTPPVLYQNGAGIHQEANAWTSLSSTGLTFPATQATEAQTLVFSWDTTAPGNSVPSGQFTFFGSDIRFLVSTLGTAIAATNTFSMNIWAQT